MAPRKDHLLGQATLRKRKRKNDEKRRRCTNGSTQDLATQIPRRISLCSQCCNQHLARANRGETTIEWTAADADIRKPSG
eukprot:1202754-Pleurochrysis_carterae.AAC.2